MAINQPKGTHDIYGIEAKTFRKIEDVFAGLAELYAFNEMRTPIFEATELFTRGVGDASDIVRKEMFTFDDKGGRSITLRPEGTAGVMRAILSQKLYATDDLPLKYYYYGPVFRYERPQKGRYREFRQFGVESVGVTSPFNDVEVVIFGLTALSYLGFEHVQLKINSIGGAATREKYRQALVEYFAQDIDHMCEDCHVRYEINPLRILDCKVEADQKIIAGAPKINDFLTPEEQAYFNKITETLDSFGIRYEIDHGLVRGLDYYSDFVFEFHYISEKGENYGAIGAGGHYDRLLAEVGGPALAGVGLAFGLERLYLIMEDNQLLEKNALGLDVLVMNVGENSADDAFSILTLIRNSGFRADMNSDKRSFKALFKRAERQQAKLAVIIGDDEITKSVVQVKDLQKEEQFTVPYEDLIAKLDEFLSDDENDHHHEEE